MIKTTTVQAWLLGLLLATGVLLVGCSEPGPAEQAGAAVDEAMEDASESLEEAGEATREAVERAEEQIEQAVE